MERCAGSWENFNQMLLSTPPGNNGNIGMYFVLSCTGENEINLLKFSCQSNFNKNIQMLISLKKLSSLIIRKVDHFYLLLNISH